jgi:hypothetical protein
MNRDKKADPQSTPPADPEEPLPLSDEEQEEIRELERRGFFRPPPEMATLTEWKIF